MFPLTESLCGRLLRSPSSAGVDLALISSTFNEDYLPLCVCKVDFSFKHTHTLLNKAGCDGRLLLGGGRGAARSLNTRAERWGHVRGNNFGKRASEEFSRAGPVCANRTRTRIICETRRVRRTYAQPLVPLGSFSLRPPTQAAAAQPAPPQIDSGGEEERREGRGERRGVRKGLNKWTGK